MATNSKTIGERVTAIALRLLKQHPDGIRYSELRRKIVEIDHTLNPGTVQAFIWDLHVRLPHQVYKPSRGLFRLVEFRDKETDGLKPELVHQFDKKIKEPEFYLPFADWLVNEVEECTKAVSLGGKIFGDKWGTPDVIGKRESKKSDILQAPTEIVCAEIKIDSFQLITAFGQACAYSLFSHKSYLVVPKLAPKDDISRLNSLCQGYGIGLVLFDTNSPENPGFTILVRPRKHDPDMFYTNKYLKVIEDRLF